MADEPKRPFLTAFQAAKAYHRPGWEAYARKVETEREVQRQNAPIVLREKSMKTGNTDYTFSIIRKKNGRPYLRISGYIAKTNHRGTVIVFAPYVPAFLGILQEFSKGLET
jgi:hypothetical protein